MPNRTHLDLERPADLAVLAAGVEGFLRRASPLGLRRGWLVSSGRERRLLAPDIEIIPWAEIALGQIKLF